MKRMKLRIKRKYKKVNFILFIFIILVICIIYILKIFSQKAFPIFINYSEIEVKRIATLVINNTLMNEVGANITIDDLFIIKEDNNGDIVSIDVDPAKANKLLINANKVLEQNFKYLEKGEIDKLKINSLDIDNNNKGIIYKLPSGIIFNNIFLNNLFPKIPVKLNLVGTVFSKLATEVDSYGINNAVFKVNIQSTVTLKVILPFTSSNIDLVANIPIIIKIIEGNVPSYYLGDF